MVLVRRTAMMGLQSTLSRLENLRTGKCIIKNGRISFLAMFGAKVKYHTWI